MTYELTRDGSTVTVRAFGHLDIKGSPVLEEALTPELDGVDSLTVDLGGVDYVSSMGLRLLLSLQKRMTKQGSMVVSNVPEPVMALFDETGFSDILIIR